MPRVAHVHNQTPAELPDVFEVATVPIAVVPFALGALESRIPSYIWSEDGYLRGNQLIRSLQMSLLCGGMTEITARQDQLYRLLDSGLNGTVYTAAGDPVVVSPSIPEVPTDVAELPGLVARIDHLEQMLDALPGITDPGWFGFGGSKATIADVVRSLRVGNSEQAEAAMTTFGDILTAGGNTATIADLVVDAFSTGVDTVTEGGIFVMLAASAIGNIAAMGAIAANQVTQMSLLNRIIHDLDGGGFGLPDDNILQAIRGDESASETRNVIDSIVAALATITTDSPDVLAKLEEIRLLLV